LNVRPKERCILFLCANYLKSNKARKCVISADINAGIHPLHHNIKIVTLNKRSGNRGAMKNVVCYSEWLIHSSYENTNNIIHFAPDERFVALFTAQPSATPPH